MQDCWISIFGKVYDFTSLIKANPGPLVQPLIEKAGKDISNWFDEATGDVSAHTQRLYMCLFLWVCGYLHASLSLP